MSTVASILWQRLDVPGHDACRLEQLDAAWQIDGAAVFRQADGRVAQLHYRVRCDRLWHTQWGTVRGWVGAAPVDLSVSHDAHGRWMANEVAVPELGHCVDLDLGFTPATNLIALRRLRLAVGERAAAPAAWFDLEEGSLGVLAQQYERHGRTTYDYEAPRFDCAARLTVTDDGFVSDYPGLWTVSRS
ncbi:MAG: putative glycolipid-binding domain-containing protein [Luteibacter sp.]